MAVSINGGGGGGASNLFAPKDYGITIKASSWGASGVYSLEDRWPSERFDVYVAPDQYDRVTGDAISDEALKAWNRAVPVGSSSLNQVRCMGPVPTVDVPVIVRATYLRSITGTGGYSVEGGAEVSPNDWEQVDGKWQYSFEDDWPAEDYDLYVAADASSSPEAARAWADASPVCSSTVNKVVLTGRKPETSIRLMLYVCPALSTLPTYIGGHGGSGGCVDVISVIDPASDSPVCSRAIASKLGSFEGSVADQLSTLSSKISSATGQQAATVDAALSKTSTNAIQNQAVARRFEEMEESVSELTGGASTAVKAISRSGLTYTATRIDGTTFSFTQQDQLVQNSSWEKIRDRAQDSTTEAHGFLPKLSGDATQYLGGDGRWASIPTGAMSFPTVTGGSDLSNDAHSVYGTMFALSDSGPSACVGSKKSGGKVVRWSFGLLQVDFMADIAIADATSTAYVVVDTLSGFSGNAARYGLTVLAGKLVAGKGLVLSFAQDGSRYALSSANVPSGAGIVLPCTSANGYRSVAAVRFGGSGGCSQGTANLVVVDCVDTSTAGEASTRSYVAVRIPGGATGSGVTSIDGHVSVSAY